MPYTLLRNTTLCSAAFASFLATPLASCAATPLTAINQTVPNSQNAPSMEAGFATPPDGARPWVYWFVMDGNFTREGITADLEAMKRAGIGGVIYMEVNVGIPQGPVKFMSPQWQQLFAHAVHEAERLGLAITLNGGPGWTGSGGPWVKPEQSMQNIVSAAQDISGPQHFDGVLPRAQPRSNLSDYYRDVRVLAFPKPSGNQRIADFNQKSFYDRDSSVSASGVNAFYPSYANYLSLPASEVVDSRKVVDLTAQLGADGRLNWDVPPGAWTILRFGAINNGASTRPAPVPGLGLESDKFSATALDAHFQDFIGPLLKTVGPRKVTPTSGWNALHIDSWEVGTQNWTPAFATEFQKRRGYDPTPYFPALSGLVVDSPEKSERFLWDWRQTCQELVVENHVQHFKDIGKPQGFGLSIEPYDKVMASDVSLGAPATVPMGEFWLYDPPVGVELGVTEAASIGHTNGRDIVGAESFTSGPSEAWRADPAALKPLGDWAFSAGINRFVIHRYQHQPDLDKYPGMTMGPYGVHWERTQTWWDMVPAYHRYLARCQFLLRQGLPVSDVCYLVAEGAPQVFHAPASATKGSPPERLGYSFDACAPENLIQHMTFKRGQLTLPDGMSYRVLVLPERDTMTPALLRKVARLVADGATVIGPRPSKSPSLSGYDYSDSVVQRLAALVWGNCDGLKVTQHKYGKGRVVWQRSGEGDISRPTPSPFAPSQWIWYPEGNPADRAPVAKRYFRRAVTIENVAQLSSARITMTADNSFELMVNGQRAGEGNDWRTPFSFEVSRHLKNGANTFTVMADNGLTDSGDTTPNPAGLIGTIRLTYRDGRVVEIPTDNQWESAQQADAAQWLPALALGIYTAGPWNLRANLPPEQYGNFGTVEGVLQGMKLPMDFASDGPVRYIHRRAGNTDLYFVANRESRLVNANCTFRVTGKAPELWNTQTGERRALPLYSTRDGVTTVPLRFEPNESWFVVFKPSKAANAVRTTPAQSNFPTLSTLSTVTGAWHVSFDPKWGGPASVTFPTLEDWTQRPESGIRFYSGKATYRKTLMLPAAKTGARMFLDLGTIKNLAHVKLNGRDLGVVWCAPWRVEMTSALHPGANQLEIEVANLWPNRLIGDQALPENQRLTSTTWNFYSKDSPLLPSGLLGPVTVVAER